MDLHGLVRAAAALPWRHTERAGPPHEYVMAHWSLDAARFAWAAGAALVEHGFDGEWGGRRWRYLEPGDGHTYWMMPASAWPFVVNRRPTSRMQP